MADINLILIAKALPLCIWDWYMSEVVWLWFEKPGSRWQCTNCRRDRRWFGVSLWWALHRLSMCCLYVLKQIQSKKKIVMYCRYIYIYIIMFQYMWMYLSGTGTKQSNICIYTDLINNSDCFDSTSAVVTQIVLIPGYWTDICLTAGRKEAGVVVVWKYFREPYPVCSVLGIRKSWVVKGIQKTKPKWHLIACNTAPAEVRLFC